MSKSDEMFEELGYEKIIDDETTLNYEKEGLYADKEIIFEKQDKTLTIGYATGENCHTSMQELQAIYQFCKERGWLDE